MRKLTFVARAQETLSVAVLIGISWWGLTYVPVVQDMLPSIIMAPDPTITVTVSDADVAATNARVPANRLDDACHDIPFLLRPIASRPLNVKVILNYQQQTVGEVVYSCQDGHQISPQK